MDRDKQINTFCRYSQVSRETITSLKEYEKLLIKTNKEFNLISESTINQIWYRHFLDSFQAIDFIDKNQKTLVDIGSGAGFPGIVLSIVATDRKIPLKIKLIEKSPKKIKFLQEVIKKLKLKIDTISENVEDENFLFKDEVFIARAFKPLAKTLELIHSKAEKFKKIIIFLGKTGEKELIRTSKSWDIQYKKRMSITNSDSFIIEINKVKKR